MINKVQNQTAFRGVYIKQNGNALRELKNVSEAYNSNENANLPFNKCGFDETSYNAIVNYGLKELNDPKIDDSEKRYLSVYAVCESGCLPNLYSLGIVDEEGNEVVSAESSIDGCSVLALKNAFDGLKENYKEFLSQTAASKYRETVSSLDNAVSAFIVEDGPNNA